MASLSGIVSVVEIEDVRLREGGCRAFVRPSVAAENVLVDQSHTPSIMRSGNNNLLIRVRFRLEVREEGGRKKVQVKIYGTFELSYRVPDKSKFSAGELDEFGRVNALFNAWPYWREYVQGSLARMSMPGYTIPVLRVQREGRATAIPNGKRPATKQGVSGKR